MEKVDNASRDETGTASWATVAGCVVAVRQSSTRHRRWWALYGNPMAIRIWQDGTRPQWREPFMAIPNWQDAPNSQNAHRPSKPVLAGFSLSFRAVSAGKPANGPRKGWPLWRSESLRSRISWQSDLAIK